MAIAEPAVQSGVIGVLKKITHARRMTTRLMVLATAWVTGLTEEISNSDEHRSVINTLKPLDVEVKRLARAQIDDKRLVYMLANALRASGYKNVEPIAHARTPVIKCVYGATDLDGIISAHRAFLAYVDAKAMLRPQDEQMHSALKQLFAYCKMSCPGCHLHVYGRK